MYSMNTQSLSPMTAEQYYQQVGLSIPMSSPQQMHKEGDEIVLIKVICSAFAGEKTSHQMQIRSCGSRNGSLKFSTSKTKSIPFTVRRITVTVSTETT